LIFGKSEKIARRTRDPIHRGHKKTTTSRSNQAVQEQAYAQGGGGGSPTRCSGSGNSGDRWREGSTGRRMHEEAYLEQRHLVPQVSVEGVFRSNLEKRTGGRRKQACGTSDKNEKGNTQTHKQTQRRTSTQHATHRHLGGGGCQSISCHAMRLPAAQKSSRVLKCTTGVY